MRTTDQLGVLSIHSNDVSLFITKESSSIGLFELLATCTPVIGGCGSSIWKRDSTQTVMVMEFCPSSSDVAIVCVRDLMWKLY